MTTLLADAKQTVTNLQTVLGKFQNASNIFGVGTEFDKLVGSLTEAKKALDKLTQEVPADNTQAAIDAAVKSTQAKIAAGIDGELDKLLGSKDWVVPDKDGNLQLNVNNLSLKTKFKGGLPNLTAAIKSSVSLSKPGDVSLGFDVGLDANSFASDFVTPIFGQINKVIKPLDDIGDILNSNIPGLDTIYKTSFLKLAAELKPEQTAAVKKFFDTVDRVSHLIETAETLSADGNIALGSFSLDLKNTSPSSSPVSDSTKGTKLEAFAKSAKNIEGFSFDILESQNAFNLLLGNNTKLFGFTIAPITAFEGSFGITTSFPLPPLPIAAIFEFEAKVTLGTGLLDFGYDTFGLKTGDPLKGLYIDSKNPIFTINPKLSASLGASAAGVAELKGTVGVRGQSSGGINFLLPTSPDNKFRFLTDTNFSRLKVEGSAELFGEATFTIGPKITVFRKKLYKEFTKELFTVPLFKFGDSSSNATAQNPPNLATQTSGELKLNIGLDAGKRNVNPTETKEEFRITGNANSLVLAAFGQQDPAYSNVGKIIASADKGNDVIVIGDSINIASKLDGGDGNDTLIAGSNTDELRGGDGDDTLVGNAGNDFLYGNQGDDALSGGDGIDKLWGDDENETVTDGSDTLDGGKNDDFLYGGGGNDFLYGGENNDRLYGGSGDDSINGDSGNDHIFGGKGSNEIDGGDDIDTVYYEDATSDVIANIDELQNYTNTLFKLGRSFSIELGAAKHGFENGSEFIDKLFNLENIVGSNFNDVLIGNEKDNVITGSTGDDILIGNGGNDTLNGDENKDTLIGGANIDTLNGGTGDDQLFGGSEDDTIDGGADNDTIHYDDSLSGATVNIDETQNYSNTAYPNDLEPSFVIAAGTAGDGFGDTDTLRNLENITGSAYNDVLIGNALKNSLNGLDGNDLLIGNGGDDFLDGGDGTDTVSYRRSINSSNIGVSVDLSTGVGSDGIDGLDTLISIENIIGSQFADRLIGSNQANIILGGEGGDIIEGKEGNDRLFGENGQDEISGGSGDDFLVGGADADTIDGGANIDTVSYDDSPTGTIANIDETQAYSNTAYPSDIEPTFTIASGTALDGFGSTDTLRNLENIIGSAYDDILIGNALKNTLNGLNGNDLLIGNGGDDILDGGNGIDTVSYRRSVNSSKIGVSVDLSTGVGSDGIDGLDTLISIENLIGSQFADRLIGSNQANTILGGDGNDIIDGKEGNDRLFGENGQDEIFGGSGNDYLVGGTGADLLDGGEGNDTASYITSTAGILASLVTKTGAFADAQGDRFISIENLEGSEYDDFLYGDDNDNILSGLGGNDTIRGEAGDDRLDGGTGDNLLNAGEGNNTIVAADGKNTVYAESGNDSVLLGNGNNTVFAGKGNNTVVVGNGDNTVYAESGNDSIVVGNGNNTVFAGDGKNTITAGSGNDTLYGGAGTDVIDAGAGNNTVFAYDGQNIVLTQDGNDIIYGGAGRDFISAGGGNDTIFAGDGDNWIAAGTGNNLIYSGNGQNLFILEAGTGATTIENFAIGKDKLGLTAGLQPQQLTISQVNSDGFFGTQISIAGSGDVLARLEWTPADRLTASSFTPNLPLANSSLLSLFG